MPFALFERTMKRITVTFRGTVGGTDFLADANFNPNREHFGHLGRDVKVHSGFSGMLCSQCFSCLSSHTLF